MSKFNHKEVPLDPDEAPDGYYAVKDSDCSMCHYRNDQGACLVGKCNSYERKDGVSVIFKRKEAKV